MLALSKLFSDIPALRNPFSMCIWFWVGMFFARYRDYFNTLIRKNFHILFCILTTSFTTVIVTKYYTQNSFLQLFLAYAGALSGICATYCLCLKTSDMDILGRKVTSFAANSMWVYLYAAPFRYPLFIFLIAVLGRDFFRGEIPYAIFLVSDTIIPILTAYAFTNLLRKTPLKFVY